MDKQPSAHPEARLRLPLQRGGRALLPLLLACTLSCSIWEERQVCPCILSFRLQKDCGLSGSRSLSLSLYNETGGILLDEEGLVLNDLRDDGRPGIEVPKGQIRAGGVIGLRSGKRGSGGQYISIPAGLPADSLFWLSGRTDATGETAVIPVRVRKEYSAIEIRFILTEGTEPLARCPYFLYLRSYTAGLDLRDGTPLPGRFHCLPEEDQAGVFRSILPRQRTPEDLVLEVREKEGPHELLDEIPLNAYLPKEFSWQDEDLKDIRMRIDYAHARVEVSVGDWGVGEIYQYTI